MTKILEVLSSQDDVETDITEEDDEDLRGDLRLSKINIEVGYSRFKYSL